MNNRRGKQRTSRITLGQLMGAIAVVAFAFAAAPVPMAFACSLFLLVIGGIRAVSSASWFRIAAWTAACYPVLLLACLYTSWGVAGYALGHRPRPSLDDPGFITGMVDAPYRMTWSLMFGVPAAFGINLLLAIIEIARTVYTQHNRFGGAVARVGLPMLTWPLAFIWCLLDPWSVLFWFMD